MNRTPNQCHTCEGTGWTPGSDHRTATDACRACYGSGVCQDPTHTHRAPRQTGWWEK